MYVVGNRYNLVVFEIFNTDNRNKLSRIKTFSTQSLVFFAEFKMLTEIEMKMLDWVFYNCCRTVTIPFKWNRNRMSVNVTPINVIIGNYVSWFILLPLLIFEAFQILSLANSRDINGIILNGTLVLSHAANLLFKLNIWCFKEQMVQFINGILEINSSWGTLTFD